MTAIRACAGGVVLPRGARKLGAVSAPSALAFDVLASLALGPPAGARATFAANAASSIGAVSAIA